MNLWVGTSGYSYKEWKGKFYPEKLPAKEMLSYYGTQLGAVEINNTFYRMPKESVLEAWTDQVPEDFRFSVKASRRITHFKRLKEAGEEAEYLVRTVRALGARLGVLLFQLPPNLKQDLDRLGAFLNEDLPPGVPVAFEFRHDSWQNEETYAVLREADCALCVADTDEGDTPLVSTAETGYIRLRRTEYSDVDLKDWAARIADIGWKDAFVFFKHEDEAAGPKMALRFRELAG